MSLFDINISSSLIIFTFLLLFYFLIGRKISAWTTISRLGFSSETPEVFLRHSKIYHFIPIALFLVAVIPLVFTNIIIFIFGIIVLLSISFAVAILGRKEGVKTYRNILQEMLNEDKSLDDKEKEEIAQKLDKSDTQLLSGLRLFY